MSVSSKAGKRIFISYTKANGAAALAELKDALVAAGHVPVGDWDLVPGDQWNTALKRILNTADGAIVVVGLEALKSAYIAEETATMFAH